MFLYVSFLFMLITNVLTTLLQNAPQNSVRSWRTTGILMVIESCNLTTVTNEEQHFSDDLAYLIGGEIKQFFSENT